MPAVPIDANERDEILALISKNPEAGFAEIARHVDRGRSTISREVTRNGRQPGVGQPRRVGAHTRRRRPKQSVLAVNTCLRERVIKLVKKGNSPRATGAPH